MAKPTSINQLIQDDPDRLEDYEDRVAAALASMNKMPRGARAKCGYDLEISPTSVSRVLSGKRVSLVTLIRIEDWLDTQVIPA